MTNLSFIILMLIKVSCIGNTQHSINNQDVELFSNYLNSYQAHPLPIELDRKVMSKLRQAENNQFNRLGDNFKKYLPDEIINIDTVHQSTFRGLYLLPELDSAIFVLLAQYIFIENDQYSAIKVHMISYNKMGKIIDFQELAEFYPDISESFTTITNPYKIEKKQYQFGINTNKEYSKLFYLKETVFEFNVNHQGDIEEVSNNKTEGYFEGGWDGYKLIKRAN